MGTSHFVPAFGYMGVVDKSPRLSINNVIWIFSSDTIFQLNPLFLNSEAAMLLFRQSPSSLS